MKKKTLSRSGSDLINDELHSFRLITHQLRVRLPFIECVCVRRSVYRAYADADVIANVRIKLDEF